MTLPIPRPDTPVLDGNIFSRQWWSWLAGLGAMDSTVLRSTDVVIPAAAVKTLNATPVTLVPGPGADKYLVFEGLHIYKPAGTAYSGIASGEDLSVRYVNGSGREVAQCEATGFLGQSTAQLRYVRPFAATSGDATGVDYGGGNFGQSYALVLWMSAGEITTGTSDLRCRTFYRILPQTL